MNKRTTLSLLLIFSLGAGLSSCTKKEGPDTPFTRLLGKWKKVKYATDDNNNNAIDGWEVFPVQPNSTNTIEFKKDSTGVEKTTSAPDLEFRWEILGDLSVKLNYKANDTIIYRLISVTSHDLNMTTRATLSLAGYYYEKQ